MSVHRYMSTQERFYAQTIPVPEAGCLLWIGTWVKGYGQFRVTSSGKRELAHRYALEQKLGRPIRDGMMSCHTCDTPSCVQEGHLYEGTARSNADDAMERGRLARGKDLCPETRCRGVDHHSARLTPDEVLIIREHRQSYKQLAKRFGVSTTAVQRIIRGRTWKHLKSEQAA